jgi:tetratricopeptide (TPR) repeat protein
MFWALMCACGSAPAWAGGLAAIDAFHVGRHHLANGNREQALASFNEALRLNPQFVQAYVARGKLLAESGQYSSALADLNFALHLQPTHAEGFAYRGFALLALGRSDEALPDLDAALRLDPTYARAHHMRGHTLRLMGRTEEAEISLAAALELDPTLHVVQVVTAEIDPETNAGVVQLAGPTALDRTSLLPSTVVEPPPVDKKREGNLTHFSKHASLANLKPPAISRPPKKPEDEIMPRFTGPVANTARSLRPGISHRVRGSLEVTESAAGAEGAEQAAVHGPFNGRVAAALAGRPAPLSARYQMQGSMPAEGSAENVPVQIAQRSTINAPGGPPTAAAPVTPPSTVPWVTQSPQPVEPEAAPTLTLPSGKSAAAEPTIETPADPNAAPAGVAAPEPVAPPAPITEVANSAEQPSAAPAVPAAEAGPVFIADDRASEPAPVVREVFAPLPGGEPVIVGDDQPWASSRIVASTMSSGLMPSAALDGAADRLTLALESARVAAAERPGPALATDAPVEVMPSAIVSDQPIAEFRKDPETVEGSVSLGVAAGTDAIPATLEQLDVALREQPGNADLRLRRATLLLDEGLTAAAAIDFDEALKLDPGQINAYLGRARAKHLSGHLAEAIEDYSAVLRVDDHHAVALIERGRCLAQLGRAGDAEQDRADALALDPALAKTGPKYGAAFASDVVPIQADAKVAPAAGSSAFGNLFGAATAGGMVRQLKPLNRAPPKRFSSATPAHRLTRRTLPLPQMTVRPKPSFETSAPSLPSRPTTSGCTFVGLVPRWRSVWPTMPSTTCRRPCKSMPSAARLMLGEVRPC